MITKTLEIRDKGTHIPALAIRMRADSAVQSYYIHGRCGHPPEGSIVLMMINDCKATNDPYEWEKLGSGPRTMPTAHQYIIEYFDELNDGDVVDVEFILGETSKVKSSERLIY